MKRLSGSRITKLIVVIAVSIVPLLYAGLMTLAYQNPTNRLSDIKAAVVNEDSAYTATLADGKTKTLNLGADLTDALTHPDGEESVGFTWEQMDAATAQADIRTQKVRAILYIPADFSKIASRVGSEDPSDAVTQELELVTDDGVNYLTDSLAATVASELSKRLEQEGAERVLSTLLLSVSTVRDGLVEASDGATALASGASNLADGASNLATGAATVDSGAKRVAVGASAAASGATDLTSGATDLSTGASDLSAGLTDYVDGVDQAYATLSGEIDPGARELATGLTTLSDGVGSTTDSAAAGQETLYGAANDLASGAAAAVSGIGTSSDSAAAGQATLYGVVNDYIGGVSATRAGAGQVLDALAGVYQQCVSEHGQTDATCQAITRVAGALGTPTDTADSATVLGGLNALTASGSDVTGAVGQVASGADQLSSGTIRLQSAVGQIATGVTEASTGAATLAGALGRSADVYDASTGSGATLTGVLAALSARGDTLTAGAATISSGASRLATGSNDLSAGLNTLSAGASTLSSGTSRLAGGTNAVNSGARNLSAGAGALASGLDGAAAQIPDYTAAQRRTMTEVGADTAGVGVMREHPVANNGAGFTPMFMSLSLWVGAISLFLVLPALDRRDHGERWYAAATRPAVTAALLAVAQAVVMMVAVNAAGGIHAANLPGLCAMAIAASLTFVAINQACLATLAFRGRFVSVALLSLQIASMGATFPIETTPRFFQWIHPYLPMSYTQLAFRRLIAGGGVDGIYLQTLLVLAVWALAAWAFILLGARLRRGPRPLPADNALAPTAA
ncbi:YhgE/Pip domain-containing protein [Actinomyces sp.]|uniref:YhgE/Pip domain-containing protein n=1 Tax=Actinomyces sp. TaxID=29317 RepID=UPI0026DB92C1|nr:YhgE/Pip domain-containing protein [Actinomyces sp.]MDO4901792.1 YhgE/Pip domain-containing protein [Actinomyces sp.]